MLPFLNSTRISAQSLIRKKRNGFELNEQELYCLAKDIGDGVWTDSQIAAWTMAVAWRGMSISECRNLTMALCHSGEQLNWQGLNGPVLDKHSTGGVGDGVSLLLAPILAACDCYVPMISGRGLGYTGGTLDKLESIPGYDINPSTDKLKKIMEKVGCAIIGQSKALVPADKRIYATRDITETVDIPELIVSSILSKKIAGGAKVLVIDIKKGNGAQIADFSMAQQMAQMMSKVVENLDLKLKIAFTDMNQMLGYEAGNALEIQAIVDILKGGRNNERLRILSLEFASELMCLSGLTVSKLEAQQKAIQALESGKAAERFAQMVFHLGGPIDFLEKSGHYLDKTTIQGEVLSSKEGYVSSIDVKALGQMVVDLGGGRTHPEQKIDKAVGLVCKVNLGDKIQKGQPLMTIHARTLMDLELLTKKGLTCFEISNQAPEKQDELWTWK